MKIHGRRAVAKADLQPENVAIEGLCGPEIPYLDRDFVHALDTDHRRALLSRRTHARAPWNVHRRRTLLSQ